jgi:hypothetical protein
LWNKLARADPDSWLAHQALVENVQMWQDGNNDCWAARFVSHLHQLDILPAGTSSSGSSASTPALWRLAWNEAIAAAN